jgi:signal transduction histidine kinase
MDALGRLYAAARRHASRWARRHASRHPHTDLAVAAVVCAVTLLTTTAGRTGRQLDVSAVAFAAVACGVLVARRRWPLAVLLTSAAAAEAYLVHYQGHQGSMVLAAPLIALYTVADTSSRHRSLVIGVLAVLAFAGLHMLVKPSSLLGVDNLALAALGGLAVAAGDASRNRRAYLAEAQARAEHAEADRDAEAARRVTEERLRIARDLHDVVGHHLALIYVQAGVAAHVLDREPEKAAEALAHIRGASKTALGELRDTIGLLRQPDEQAAPTEPVVGLAGVDELLGSFRRSGLTITEHVDGPVRRIAVAADLTAYRVIQESLTNVCKHAGPTAVSVRLTYRPDLLRIVVDNAAAGHAKAAAPAGRGHGLIGMRERVTALGGTLRCGPRPDGGFRVTATLPTPAGSPA